MVMYDMIMVPMSLFNLPDSLFLTFMEWLTRLFWTFDMGMSMRTAVILNDGSVNFEWGYIMQRYLRTWFVLDVFIVGTDWIEFALSASTEAGDFMGLSRVFRSA